MQLLFLALAVGGWLFWETAIRERPLPERQVQQEFVLDLLASTEKPKATWRSDVPPSFLPWEEFAREHRAQAEIGRNMGWSAPTVYVKYYSAPEGGCDSLNADFSFQGRDGIFRDARITRSRPTLGPYERILDCRVDDNGFFYRITWWQ